MIKNKRVTAVILAAGNSVRYKGKRNKNFEIINNKVVLNYSLTVFDKNKYVDELVVAVKEKEKEEVKKIIKKELLYKDVKIINGGRTRKESVYNCISSIDSDIVIIHDGARPLIKDSYVSQCIENMDKYKGVTVGIKVKDTIKITDANNIVINTTNRSNTWQIQTPQCFDRKVLLKMHEKYKNEDATDDCYLLEKNRYRIKVIEGDYTNIKITTYEDLDVIKGLVDKVIDKE